MDGVNPRLSHVRSTFRLPGILSFLLCHSLDGPLALEPSATVFHYAQTLFEGMKAYRDTNGKVTLFRPDMNMKRMNLSAARVALPVGCHKFLVVHDLPLWGARHFRHSMGTLY